MKPKLVFKCFCYFLLIVLFSGCQQATQPPENTQVIPSDTLPPPTLPPTETETVPPTETATATTIPTDTTVPETPTLTLSPEQPVGSLDEILGTWKGYWSDATSLYYEFLGNSTDKLTFPEGELISKQVFKLEDGLIEFTKIIESASAEPKCWDNPAATYEIYITRRGDQPVSLRFVLVGEDNCMNRKEFLNGRELKWLEP